MSSLIHERGTPDLTGQSVIQVPMDGYGVSSHGEYLTTKGVTDCLAIVLHDTVISRGALAHISFPRSLNHAGTTNNERIIGHVRDECDKMLTKIGVGSTQDVEVLLWRGDGFGSSGPASRPDVIGNIFADMFKRIIDLMAHFTAEEIERARRFNRNNPDAKVASSAQPSLPYRSTTSVTYNPIPAKVWFP